MSFNITCYRLLVCLSLFVSALVSKVLFKIISSAEFCSIFFPFLWVWMQFSLLPTIQVGTQLQVLTFLQQYFSALTFNFKVVCKVFLNPMALNFIFIYIYNHRSKYERKYIAAPVSSKQLHRGNISKVIEM